MLAEVGLRNGLRALRCCSIRDFVCDLGYLLAHLLTGIEMLGG